MAGENLTEPKRFSLEEIVRVGHEAVAAIVPGYRVTDEIVAKGVEDLKQSLAQEFPGGEAGDTESSG